MNCVSKLSLFFLVLLQISFTNLIIDSDLTFEEAIKGTTAPKEIIDSLVLINVVYYSFDNKLHRGQLVVHKSVQKDITDVFELIRNERFPVANSIPIVKYNWSDSASMANNNTSSFNYRKIAGTNRLSLHSYGLAVDINPFNNPVVYNDGRISPKGAKYNPKKIGTFTSACPIVQKFKELGWRWGGEFNSFKDYHHFDKILSN
ncbi:MAG: M15 family metallopeptidase [Bacteroidota bacterium]